MLRVEARTTLGGAGSGFTLDALLEAPAGTCLALAGPSGAGKSTLLRIAAGLLRPAHGRVECGDDVWLDTSTDREFAPEQRRCGYVFQDYALFGHMTVWQNVAYGLRGVGRHERRRRAVELLDRFATDFPAALALSAVLVVVSGTLLLSAKLLAGPGTEALRASR